MTVRPNAAALLKKARLRAVLTQQQLAAAAGVSRSTLAMVEAGTRTPSGGWLMACASGLGVDPSAVGVCLPERQNVAPGDNAGESLPPLDPSGRTITLVIDYADGRDDPHRLVAATDADAAELAGLGMGRRLDPREAEFRRMLVLASNRRIDVLFRYDRKPRPCPVK
jgi:transcriptional regulator with XRE-family HTH domain